jgi:hypothetical protein
MKHRTAIYIVLLVIGLIVLALPTPKATRHPKIRASRITGVNNLSSVSLTLTNVSALPGAQPVIGK